MKLNQIAEPQPSGGWVPKAPSPIHGWGTSLEFLNPDSFHGHRGAITFIYTVTGELLWTDATEDTHNDLVAENRWYFDKYGYRDVRSTDVREVLEAEGHLVGRVSSDVTLVAFWNTADQLYGLLESCIAALLEENLINPDTVILLENHDYVTTASNTRNLNNLDTRQEQDPQKEREAQLRRELHLMKPQQKKAAMKELGLVGGGHKQPWQKAAEQNQLVSPGQKWWAPTSESTKG